jgi:glutamate synthase domain-containing protein 3
MTGGRAFIWDPQDEFPKRVNGDLVRYERVHDSGTLGELHDLIVRHVELTGSRRGRDLLHGWERTASQFWQVVPKAVPTPKTSTTALETIPTAGVQEETVATR